MTKFILILSLGSLAACTSEYEPCKDDLEHCSLVNEHNLRQFHDACKTLANCMHAEYEVVHMAKQTEEPYACSIWKQTKQFKKGHYLYPQGEVSFGKVQATWPLSNELFVCENMTETGRQSDAEYTRLYKVFARMDQDRKEAQERNKPKTLPPMKIREGAQ